MQEKQIKEKKKLDYKWVVIALCAVMIFICLGFCSGTKGLFVKPITEYHDIERSLFSFNSSCRYIATSIVNIFFGSLIVRFGAKKLIAAGFVALLISMLLYAFANNLFLFYLAGVFLGIGCAWTGTTIVGYVVNKWCKQNRGTIMGAILAVNGLGGALATAVITPIINSAPDGYRTAFLVISAIVLFFGIIIVAFMKDKPKDAEELDAPAQKKKGRGEGWVGIEYKQAVKKAYFYGAAVCIFCCGMVLQGITGVAKAHMSDVGISEEFATLALSIGWIVLTVAKLFTGFVYDRKGIRLTTFICCVCSVGAMLTLAFLSASAIGNALTMSYVIFAQFALPLETIMLPIYASDLFGDKAYNKVLGIFVSVNTAGYALGEPLLNLCYDIFGSYKYALIVCAVLMAVVLLILQFVISAAKKTKNKVLSENIG